MSARDLEDRVVIVVGAGSSGHGLSNGEAAALAYAEAGALVAVVDVSAAETERVTAEIASGGGRAVGIAADVTREDDVVRAVGMTREQLGDPHVLHHNVGAPLLGGICDVDLEAWNQSLALNLTSAYLTCRHVLPLMQRAGRGVITTVSSVAAIRDTGYVYPAYNAAKAALNQLTVSIALTHAREGIRANAIMPGLIETPLVTAHITADPAALAARHEVSPTGRMGTPRDVANAAVFLASDRAAYINGVCLPVDGGLSARSR